MADAPILIDAKKCVGCGKCVKGCGFGALALKEAPGANKLGKLAEVDPSACKACYACVSACPFKAIAEVKSEVVGTEGLSDYRDIWVFAEQTEGKVAEVVFELLTKARELKAQRGDGCRVCAVLLGNGLPADVEGALAAYGADVVYKVEAPELAGYEANVYVDAVAQLVAKHKPEVILAGATAIGRAFFARVAVKVRTGLTADCTMLKIENTRNKDTGAMQMLLHQTRPAFGGNIMAHINTPNHRPQFATVRYKIFPFPERVVHPAGVKEFRTLPPEKLRSAITVEQIEPLPVEKGIEEAAVIVAAGKGVRRREDLGMLRELAEALHGQLAGSRCVIEAGWLDHKHQIGLSGRTVAPKLIICCGISGSVQFAAGMKGSEKIVAINTDPDAPIFKIAHIGIVGDIYEVIPALLERIRAKGAL